MKYKRVAAAFILASMLTNIIMPAACTAGLLRGQYI